ncbi:hypothetical protein Tco_0593138 [Tanacetum coccineum]
MAPISLGSDRSAHFLDAFSPCHSPTGNLARLLNVAQHRIGFRPCKLPRWQVVEDDKDLYLIRAMTGLREEYAKTFAINEGFMSEKCEKDVEESLTKRELVPKKETERLMDLNPILELFTGDKIAPSEYYYHRMKNARKLDPLAEYIECRFQATMDVSMCFRVSYDPENAQAIHIIIGGGMDTDDPFGGYAIEISLPDWFYQTENAEINDTDGINITIPKKKGKSIQTIGGNLIFFLEREICEATLWRPT